MFSGLLINSVKITRYVAGAIDAYGNPAKTWSDHLVGEPCRISYPKGRQVQRGTEVIPVEILLFTDDVDITEYDRAIVNGVTYEILFVARLQGSMGGHHLEVSLQRVKP